MAIMNFTRARECHAAVRGSCTRIGVKLTRDLWNAIVGIDDQPTGFAQQAIDMRVSGYLPVLAAPSGIAAAYALDLLSQAESKLPGDATPRQERRAARAAWEEFEKRAANQKAMETNFGWDMASSWETTEVVNLPDGDLDIVARVARLAGRMFAALQGKRAARVAGQPGELHGIEMGNDIGRMFASERLLLDDPEYGTAKLGDWVERRCLQASVRGSAPVSKGPLSVVLDESTSMSEQRRIWSKAAAVAIMRVAFAERRKVVVVHFSTSVVARPIEPGDQKAMLAMILSFLRGGTDIGAALEESARQIRALAAKGDAGADTILVTDGVDYGEASQKAGLASLAALSSRLWLIAIDEAIPVDNLLRKAAVSYTYLNDAAMHNEKGVLALAKV